MKSPKYKTLFEDYYYFNRYDIKTQGLKMMYFNIHDKVYKIKKMQRTNSGDIPISNKLQKLQMTVKPNRQRAISPRGSKTIKAFVEANSFINKRKIRSHKIIELPPKI